MTQDGVPSPETLRAWMEEQAFDAEGLAEALGVGPVTVYRWLSGRRPLSRTIWLALQYVGSHAGARRRRIRNRDAGRPLGTGFTAPLYELYGEDGELGAMLPEDFIAWMEQNAFSLRVLAEALDVHHGSVAHWRTGKHPMWSVTALALRWLERDKRALRARQQMQSDFEGARSRMVRSRQRARDVTLAGAIR